LIHIGLSGAGGVISTATDIVRPSLITEALLDHSTNTFVGNLATNAAPRRCKTWNKYLGDSCQCDRVATGISVASGQAYVLPHLHFRQALNACVCRHFPELSPTVYGGGQTRSTYRGHGASNLSSRYKQMYLIIYPFSSELIEHGGDVPGLLPIDDQNRLCHAK
jgi:hypothetical protein